MIGRNLAAGLLLAFALASPAIASCDQAQAIDEMTKLTTALGEKAGEASSAEDSAKIIAANEKVNQGGEALGKGDYDKACEIYESIAKDNGISLQ